eukprot:gb/GEZN01012551.1/.p1 GENE.gb/GEZN01012551.1/~~gb/GEZN01012551.1/.p1  ORF type:complete len:185 (+),score=22.31 gb/GEZN01012551.1/:156-710(+)
MAECPDSVDRSFFYLDTLTCNALRCGDDTSFLKQTILSKTTTHNLWTSGKVLLEANRVTGSYKSGYEACDGRLELGGQGSVQMRLSFDWTGDGVWDRVETYVAMKVQGASVYKFPSKQSIAKVEGASQAWADMVRGKMRLEVWEFDVGAEDVTISLNGGISRGTSWIRFPYGALVTQACAPPKV